jgi:hypothetical protein
LALASDLIPPRVLRRKDFGLIPASLLFGVAQTLNFKPKLALAPEALFNHTGNRLPRSRRLNHENFVVSRRWRSLSIRAIELVSPA